MSRITSSLQSKIMDARDAAALISSGSSIAMSGFTSVSYPKALPHALAELGIVKDLSLYIGASVGDEIDGGLVRAGLVLRRYPYQSHKDMRNAVNDGSVMYSDMHLSSFPGNLLYGKAPRLNMAILECTAIRDGGIVLGASGGCSTAAAQAAERVILEVNEALPEELEGMHDLFDAGAPPHARIIPITSPQDRIGEIYLPIPRDKIAAVVLTDRPDPPGVFAEPNETSRRIGEHICTFLRAEVASGRLEENLGPIQSGVGSTGNAVLHSLKESGFHHLSMYTEVAQDAALELLDEEVFDFISTCSISLSAERRQQFFRELSRYHNKILIRPQDISNSPEVIRRLGVIAINTPIEADIYGNVNSTHIAYSRIMNGIGGSGDFTRNARISIFATPSTAKDGKVSCIVPMVSHVDHTEHDVQILVTEQGLADLRWKSPRERAELIIEHCAHPDYRPLLRDYFLSAQRHASGLHTPHIPEEAILWHKRFLETGRMK